MAEPRDRSDLVLNPSEYAFLQDRSKGNISVNVGPLKTSMSDTESTVIWDTAARRFRPVNQDQAVQPFVAAVEGAYVVLSNPSRDQARPQSGKSSTAIDLDQGRRVHINGPAHFPLWPGEVAQVVAGHQLRSNEYLVVRVYNEEEARKSWPQGVVKQADAATAKPTDPGSQPSATPAATGSAPPIDPQAFRTGQLIVIRGNEVSFFIPPTGIEVLQDAETGLYARRAVTLERLEYCILLNENGKKRYVRGPDVVFPEPIEVFVEKGGQIKFRATELTSISGIHVKVIEDYEEGERQHRAGDELFITGRDQPIYFLRQEHAIVKHGPAKGDGGADAVHYAIAVPAGEGRYVLDKERGEVRLVRGPAMLLPDPRREVIVQRVIEPPTVDLWYPNNAAAKAHNEALQEIQLEEGSAGLAYLTTNALRSRSLEGGGLNDMRSASPVAAYASTAYSTPTKQLVGDSVKRSTSYTPPRTITLNTKYDGAVAIGPWVGYAVQIIGKSGQRRQVLGPATVLLEYDESLSVLELSTGTPKTDARPTRTVYLRVQNNRVSDVVDVETKDLCRAKVRVSYRVNFEPGQEEKWFAVENYVRLLTEHGGSRIRNAVKRLGIEEFYANSINVVRDSVLGASAQGGRPGLLFGENGMRAYDVEVLGVDIANADIAALLVGAQHTTVKETLAIAQSEDRLARTRRAEEVARREAETRAETQQILADLRRAQIERDREINVLGVESETLVQQRRKQLEAEVQPVLDAIADAELARRIRGEDAEFNDEKRRTELEVDATKQRLGAVNDRLVEAIARVGEEAVLEKLAQAMGPLAILENKSLQEVLGRYLVGTPFESVIGRLGSRGNGRSTAIVAG